MRIQKDGHLSVLHQVFGWRDLYRLSITVLAGFNLDAPNTLVKEANLWEGVARALPRGRVMDLGMPKPRGEVLVLGKCFAPPGKEILGASVFLRVGTVEKRVEVFGDRFFTKDLKDIMIRPRPFKTMDLTWENAFGGPGYERNPEGKGLETVLDEHGRLVVPLPNIEDPNHLMAAPDHRPPPAGFGPQGLSWPFRLRKLGAFDRTWLLNQWPALPDDFDFHFYQLAPPDQRIEGFFLGGEFCQLRGMHPEKHEQIFSLPALRCRLFLDRTRQGRKEFKEVAANLDTVVLIPHLDLGVLIWHGVTVVTGDEAEDVNHLAAFYEPADQEPQPTEFYGLKMIAPQEEEPSEELQEEALEKNPEEEEPKEEIPKEEEPKRPAQEEEDPGSAALMGAMAEEIQALESQLNISLKNLGLVVDRQALATETEVVPKSFPAERGEIDAEKVMTRMEAEIREAEQNLDRQLKELGVDPNAPFQAPSTGIPTEASGAPVDLMGLFQGLGINDPEIMAAVQALSAEIEEMEAEVATIAASPEPAPPDSPAEPTTTPSRQSEAPLIREDVINGYRNGQGFAGQDLSGLDLSNLDLAGIDLTEADLENANLSHTNLSQARLDRSILTGADLTGADLTQAGLSEVNAAGCRMSGCVLTGACLKSSDFSQADLSLVRMVESDLSGALFIQAVLERADATGALAPGAIFQEARMTGACFFEADLTAADFSGGLVDRANFSLVRASDLHLEGAQGEFSDFSGADLRKCRTDSKTGLKKSRWDYADLRGCCWDQSDFSGSDFHRANMEKAEINGCLFHGASFLFTRAREADLSKNDFLEANMKGLDLMDGSLRKARLTRADLSGANLYAVDFFKSMIQETRFDHANLDRTLLKLERTD